MSRNTIVHRLVAGDPYHRSRLHDERGNLVSLGKLRQAPLNAFWVARRKVTGQLPELPWLTFDAVARLDGLLQQGWRMVEFGSGMSTRWFADRVSTVHSIEHARSWHDRIATSLPANVRYELRSGPAYYDLSDYADGSLDIVVVDGIDRDECVSAALPKIRPGGWLYLDNSDRAGTVGGDPDRTQRAIRAESTLEAATADRQGSIERSTGLTIGKLSVHEWTLASL